MDSDCRSNNSSSDDIDSPFASSETDESNCSDMDSPQLVFPHSLSQNITSVQVMGRAESPHRIVSLYTKTSLITF